FSYLAARFLKAADCKFEAVGQTEAAFEKATLRVGPRPRPSGRGGQIGVRVRTRFPECNRTINKQPAIQLQRQQSGTSSGWSWFFTPARDVFRWVIRFHLAAATSAAGLGYCQ